MIYHAEPKGNLPMRAGGLIVGLKQIRTICFVFIFSILSFPAISTTTINSNTSTANCNNTVLDGVTDGSVDLTAGWQANNIGITWYTQGNTTASGGSSQCTYDGTITLPTQPSRTGYVFGGWRVRVSNPLLSLDTSIDGNNYYYKILDDNEYCIGSDMNSNCSDAIFSDLAFNGAGKVIFDYGAIYVQMMCSVTSGNMGEVGTPNVNTSGQYCWCKRVGFTPTGGSQQNIATSSWVLRDDFDGYAEAMGTQSDEDGCIALCQSECLESTMSPEVYGPDSTFRDVLYGQSQ